jgi:ketosteroid isomerase-like protein
VKRCPTCNKTFIDQNLIFCVDDGTPLVTVETPADEASLDETTQVRSSSRADDSSSTGPSDSSNATGERPAYQPPGSYTPSGYSGEKRKTWPWILGSLAILFAVAGLAILAVWLFKVAGPNANLRPPGDSAVNVNQRNSNADSTATNANESSNDNSQADDSTPPPTNSDAVLADLKNLENEWTVANINADKQKLNRILADDYVGVSEGKAQGKAEYLKTIERDTAIQHWNFEGLKVSLNGDRASLSGVLRLDIKDQQGQDQQLAFRFTDKFVWRDGRWQATASEVEPLPVKPGTEV